MSDLVAVVVPVTQRSEFTPDEEISLRQLTHILKSYDKFFAAPENSTFDYPDIEIKYFDTSYFGSIKAHVQLMLSSRFYEIFSEYKYVLIYHLDSLVFSDQLNEWCALDYDYIGAPWLKYEGAPYEGKSSYQGKVGNGGFSLRKVDSFIAVINSTRPYLDPETYWITYYGSLQRRKRYLMLPKKYLMKYGFFNSDNNAKLEISTYLYNDDRFIANRANYYYPDFNIAPVEIALKFSFEANPRLCFEHNNQQLPFGCHAWQKYDRSFWEPYLLK